MSDPVDDWFKREVVVHEEALTRYIRRYWPNPDDVHELRQETYARVYERARKAIPHIARPFIFKVARHLMADHIRRRRVVAIDAVGDAEVLDVITDRRSPELRTAAHDELRQLARAIDQLPPRCREIVWLRRVDDLSQREVAEHLGLSEKTIEKQMSRGMKLLASALLGAGKAEAAGEAIVNTEAGHAEQ
jgi:RNA polymerase sigma-70 factor (ECF subfamily)